jgi:peptide chain release factor subunit 1
MAARIEPRIRTADGRAVRGLAERADGAGKVLTVVVDLNPTEFAEASARQTQLTSLLDRARSQLERDDVTHEEKDALTADIEGLEAFVEGGGLPTDGALGVALFVSTSRSMFDVVRLTRSAAPFVAVADDPAVEVLAGYLTTDTWGVLLVNSRIARLFAGRLEMLGEVEQIEDEVHGRHKQGGWSQARYQRAVDEEIEAHLRRSCERFAEIGAGYRFDHVAFAAPEAVRGEVKRLLTDPLRRKLVGTIDVDVENTGVDELIAELRPLEAEAERRRETELLERWREQLATGGRAVAGLPDVSKALSEKRVDIVLAAQGSDVPRAVVEDAVLQDAGIVIVRHHDDLDVHGEIAALLRF